MDLRTWMRLGWDPGVRRRAAPRHQTRRRPARSLHVESLEERCLLSTDPVLQFNAAVLNAIRADRPTIGFLTRDLAIVHAAIYDAVNAIDQTGSVFHVAAAAPPDSSPVAAAAAAGLFTGSSLFPTHKDLFQAAYQAFLADVPDGPAKDDGIAVGRFVAEQTLIWRITDGSDAVVNYIPGDAPGEWRPTLPAFAPAQTPQWPQVTPFALDSGSQFRPDAPPALTGAEYTAAYNEVKDLGRVDSAVRTPDQTEVARFWEGKAGTPNVPGYWNEIAAGAALSQGNTLDQNARLFAGLNVGLADAIIGHFDVKYTYNRWRPITAIQLADQTGNPDTIPDPSWLPLLNTPPNPSYLSGHAAVSGAASTILADFFGTDAIGFDLTSEDLPGVTHSFPGFSAAAAEAENSVVWGGIHFRFDVTTGQALGQSVGGFVDQNFFRPTARATYRQTNIVSDVRGPAATADHKLVNPWGLSLSPDGRFRISDNGVGLSTVYDVNGARHPTTVVIPLPGGQTGAAAPTGNVRNTTADFIITADGVSAPAENIFATEDGTITAWNPAVDKHNALIEVDNSASAVYKSLTLGSNADGNFIYATNFHDGTVDVFDGNFHQVQLAGSFTDPDIPDGFAPFGIRNINGTIFVTYAKQNEEKHDDVAGPGNGFIDEFDTEGNLIGRFAGRGTLNSPHGLALAPGDFSEFSNALLVGNFGDGRINAFDPQTGAFLGQIADADGHPLANPGIWGMTFGNGAGGTRTDTLYFAAGVNHEQDGLFASISPASPEHPRSVGHGNPGFTPEIVRAVDRVFARVDPLAVPAATADQAPRRERGGRPVVPAAADTGRRAGPQASTGLTVHHATGSRPDGQLSRTATALADDLFG